MSRRADPATLRAALDGLAETDQHLEEITSQARQLHDRLADLERAQRTAAEIPGLRATAQALERDVEALDAADAPEVSARLPEFPGGRLRPGTRGATGR